MRDIYRAKVEAFNCSQCNYSAKTRIAHSGSKGFRIVKARPLTESLSNNACFESFNRSICIVFYFKHPFGSNCFLLLWQILYCPGPILHVGLDLLKVLKHLETYLFIKVFYQGVVLNEVLKHFYTT